MSEDKKDITIANETSCFTNKDLEAIEQYRAAGMPKIIELTDKKLLSAFHMHLDGRSFVDISRALHLDKIVVMHVAEKYDWHTRRLEFLDGYELQMKNQILEEKIHSQYFLMKAMHVFRKRMGKKLDKYLATDEETVADGIDFKEMSLYIKMAETVASLDAKGLARDPSTGTPAVGLNVGDGVSMKKLADGTVEITPRQKSHAEMLAELAKSKREQKSDTEKK